jgi:Domain of unknown function (DUF1918)
MHPSGSGRISCSAATWEDGDGYGKLGYIESVKEDHAMHAVIGDELVVKGRRVGDVSREGVILAIHGEDGAPPYLVRWKDGHETLFTPSSDTVVEHRSGGVAT